MNKGLMTVIVVLVVAAAVWFGFRYSSEQKSAEVSKILNLYNWSDYIAEDTLANFETRTGIKVTYDVFDSNEVLDAKILTGDSGYDVVVPSLSFLGRQAQAGAYKKIDRSTLKNYKNLDPELMKIIALVDPGNTYSIPYLWGTTGIGYNVAKVKQALGVEEIPNSWDLVLKPENLAKLKECGVSMLDAPSEIIPTALHYLGHDPNSADKAVVQQAQDLLLKLRPHITYFHSSQYINDLANGDTCVAVGWSGDILQAADRASEADNGVEVNYMIPREGAAMWFDMFAIPKDAPNPENALKFLDYVLEPDVIAGVSNYVQYANANQASKAKIDPEVLNNESIYPKMDFAKFYTFKIVSPELDKLYTSVWRAVQQGGSAN